MIGKSKQTKPETTTKQTNTKNKQNQACKQT